MPYTIRSSKGVRVIPEEQLGELFRDQFPTVYIIFHSFFLFILSVAMIVIQIVLMANNTFLSMIANGIWSGVANIIAFFSALMLSCDLFYFNTQRIYVF